MVSMSVRVVPIFEGLSWEPNAPYERWELDDEAHALLVLDPYFDDPDRRSVAFFWSGVVEAKFGGPNDEGRHTHTLHDRLPTGLWVGEVIHGRKRGKRVRHFIVPTKEMTVEVWAREIAAERLEPSLTTLAALEMLKHEGP